MKRFLYLFQVEQDLPPALQRVEGPDSDILFVSWRNRSDDPRSRFYPSSSWTQGRNRLCREVMDLEYQYYIFADDDLRLELTAPGREGAEAEPNPWRIFEAFLVQWEPAIGCCSYSWHLTGGAFDPEQECQTLRFFDALLNAFHREALPALLPYHDLLDEESECYSQNLLCSLAAELYPGHVMQTNRVRVTNTQQRRGNYETLLLSRPENLFLGMLREPERIRNFQRQQVNVQAQHPTMGPPRPKTESYAIPEPLLARRFHLAHPFWDRKRELLAMSADHVFYSDDPESPRARRWRVHRPPRPLPPPAMVPDPDGGASWPPLSAWVDPISACRDLLRRRPGLRRNPFVRLARSLFHRYRHVASYRKLLAFKPRWWARLRWRKWALTPRHRLEIPESRQEEIFFLLRSALDELRTGHIVFIDVGAGRGDVLRLLQTGSELRHPLLSIGIDPIDARGHLMYNGFVTGAVTDGAEGSAEFYRYSSDDCSSLKRMDRSRVTLDRSEGGSSKYFAPVDIRNLLEILRIPTFHLSTLVRQYGLADEILHFVKIDAQGSDLDAFRSLGEFIPRCLFLQTETVWSEGDDPGPPLYHGQSTFAEDRAVIESAGFRLFNVARFGVTPEADLLWVNEKLFRELLPGLAR